MKNMQFLISYKYLIQILNKIHLDCLKIDIEIKSFFKKIIYKLSMLFLYSFNKFLFSILFDFLTIL